MLKSRGLKANGCLHFTVRGDFLGHHSLRSSESRLTSGGDRLRTDSVGHKDEGQGDKFGGLAVLFGSKADVFALSIEL